MVERAHPLADLAAGSRECAAVTLAALPPATRLIVRGDATALASIGITLPEPCRAAISVDCALLWLGPEEYLLLASGGMVLTTGNACVVDVSHRTTALSVSGPRAAWVVNAFCALDLHPAAFPIDMCARTLFGKAEIILWRTAAETFRIEVGRSFGPYVWRCLEEARREFLD